MRQLDARRQVGQQRHPRPRVGRPSGDLRIGGRPDQLTGRDDGQVRRRADADGADPPVGPAGCPVPAPGVRGERRPRPTARCPVCGGARPPAPPPTDRRPSPARPTRRPARPRPRPWSRTGSSRPRGRAPAAARTCPSGPPQAASNSGCMLATMPVSANAAMACVVGHLGVFDPVRAAGQPHGGVLPEPAGRLPQRPADRADRVVTDGVEAGLHAGQGAGDQVVGDLLFAQVPDAATVRRGVGRRDRCSAAVREPIAPSTVRSPPSACAPVSASNCRACSGSVTGAAR